MYAKVNKNGTSNRTKVELKLESSNLTYEAKNFQSNQSGIETIASHRNLLFLFSSNRTKVELKLLGFQDRIR